MHYSSDILLWLLCSTGDREAHAQFPVAYAQDFCHLCHVSTKIIQTDCPCLHWLLNSYINADRTHMALDHFGLAEALQYLLLCSAAQRSRGMGRSAQSFVRRDDGIEIALVIGLRRLVFKVTSAHASRAEFQFGSARIGVLEFVDFKLLPRDMEFLERLFEWDARFPIFGAAPLSHPKRN